jgi:chemotaxis signal transduction protein
LPERKVALPNALVFTVNEQALALPVEVITEVVRPVWPLRLPRAPSGCLGAIDVRGQLVPLVRLGALLSLEGLARPEALADYLIGRMVLVVSLRRTVALVVDQVLDVCDIDPRAPTSAPEAALASTPIVGTCALGNRRALVLDPTRLVSAVRSRLLQRSLDAVAVT